MGEKRRPAWFFVFFNRLIRERARDEFVTESAILKDLVHCYTETTTLLPAAVLGPKAR
jgi:hypothetical protein